MNRFVRVALLSLPLAAMVTFGCARSKRQPTVVGPKPAEKPGPATPAEGPGGEQQQYTGEGGDADKGASVPTDTDSNTDSSPSPSSPSSGGGLGAGGSNPNSGGYGNNGTTGNTNNGGVGNNGSTTINPTDAEIQAHVRRVNTWDAASDRLPTGVRWLVIDLDK